MYGASVFYEDAVNEVYPEAYDAAIRQEKLEAVSYPEMEIVDIGKEGFTFKASVTVVPDVKLGQYNGLSAVRPAVEVTEEDIEKEMQPLIDRASRLEAVSRPAAEGDTVVIDFEGFDNGVPFEGGKGEKYNLTIGSGSFVPGFEEQVAGMSADEEKDIDITFPENYHKELAGKQVVFHVKVHEVKEKKTA
jgi:trigger factor